MSLASREGKGLGQQSFIRRSYVEKICEYGLVPMPFSVLSSQEAILDLYSLCDAVMFMGGEDVNPERYAEARHPETILAPEESDRVELWLLQKVLEDKKPFIGMCRGLQVLNVACGGSLHQFLPDLNLGVKHGLEGEGANYESLFEGGSGHEIELVPGTRLHSLIGKSNLFANSAHRQAVKDLGKGLLVSARSLDGVVEAVESKNPEHFCFGIQGHCEIGRPGYLEPLFAEFARVISK